MKMEMKLPRANEENEVKRVDETQSLNKSYKQLILK